MIKVYLLPVLAVVTLCIGFIVTYSISVALGHVYYMFPYISDTGAEQPECGIFGFFLNVASVFLVCSLYVRYKQVMLMQEKLELKFSKFWNALGIVLGAIASFGMNMVANFQELTLGLTHYIGAMMCFIGAMFYLFVQTKISYHFINKPDGIAARVFVLRLVLCITMAVAFCLLLWFGVLAMNEFTGDTDRFNYWRPEDGGFGHRLVSTFSEWLVGFAIMIYVLTFVIEFRLIEADCTLRIRTS